MGRSLLQCARRHPEPDRAARLSRRYADGRRPPGTSNATFPTTQQLVYAFPTGGGGPRGTRRIMVDVAAGVGASKALHHVNKWNGIPFFEKLTDNHPFKWFIFVCIFVNSAM